jgi:nucleoside-diphosphate-sugar epimerase
MTKILIAGANGYIGTFLANNLSDNFDIIPVSKNLSNFNGTFNKGIQQDLSTPWNFSAKPDIIIYAAAQHYFSKTLPTTENFFTSNVQALSNALTFAKLAKTKLFIYLSTISVLGQITDQVIDENTPVKNPSVYGATKLLGERMLHEFRSETPSIIIRLPGVVGPNLPSGRPWLNKIVKLFKEGQEVKYYNPYSQFNNICDVQTICDFVRHLTSHKITKSFSIINLASSESMCMCDVINFLRKRLKSNSLVTSTEVEKTSFTIDISTISTEYNFQPPTTKRILTRFIDNL